MSLVTKLAAVGPQYPFAINQHFLNILKVNILSFQDDHLYYYPPPRFTISSLLPPPSSLLPPLTNA